MGIKKICENQSRSLEILLSVLCSSFLRFFFSLSFSHLEFQLFIHLWKQWRCTPILEKKRPRFFEIYRLTHSAHAYFTRCHEIAIVFVCVRNIFEYFRWIYEKTIELKQIFEFAMVTMPKVSSKYTKLAEIVWPQNGMNTKPKPNEKKSNERMKENHTTAQRANKLRENRPKYSLNDITTIVMENWEHCGQIELREIKGKKNATCSERALPLRILLFE